MEGADWELIKKYIPPAVVWIIVIGLLFLLVK